MNRKETVMNIIRHRKLLLFGLICRMPNNRRVKNVLLGSVDSVRQREKPPKKIEMDRQHHSVTELTLCKAVRLSQDRETWRKIVIDFNGC